MHAQFEGVLTNRRKLYPAGMRNVLRDNYELRCTGDYRGKQVTQREASAAFRRAKAFLAAVSQGR